MKKLLVVFAFLAHICVLAQVSRNDTIRTEHHPTDSISVKNEKSDVAVVADIEEANAPFAKPKYNPTKAGLYSAVLPGLGQYYNKKYWKIPVVWGAIGAGVGFTIWQDKQYKRYRNAFVAEINGVPHEFSNYNINNLKEVLGRRQDQMKRYRDYWIAGTALVYILNIVDAVVDAHLYEGKNDPDLVIVPSLIQNEYNFRENTPGITFQYNF